MASILTGQLTPTQLTAFLDAEATVLKNSYLALGIGAPSESATSLAMLWKTAQAAIFGDGSTVYGIGNPGFLSSIRNAYSDQAANARYDAIFARARGLISGAESWIQSNLPSGLKFTSSTQLHVLDAYLMRCNAANATVPTTPASAGTLVAANSAGGGLPNCAAGSATYVTHTLISSTGDWYESLPSPEATRIAITGASNSYTYQVAGNVPTGVTKMCIYRGYIAGASGTEYFDQLVTGLVPGSAYPLVTIKQPDSFLRTDWIAPAWLGCLQSPESAAIFGLAFAAPAVLSGQSINPLLFVSGGQLTPQNVFLTPSNGFLGIGHPKDSAGNSQTGIFGTHDATGAYVAGAIASANNYLTNGQGFAGAYGANCLQARVTALLNAAGTTTPTISYYDAAHGYGNAQSVALAAATFSGTGVGSTAPLVVTAGRLVYAITADTLGGGLTSGTFIFEAKANLPRAY